MNENNNILSKFMMIQSFSNVLQVLPTIIENIKNSYIFLIIIAFILYKLYLYLFNNINFLEILFNKFMINGYSELITSDEHKKENESLCEYINFIHSKIYSNKQLEIKIKNNNNRYNQKGELEIINSKKDKRVYKTYKLKYGFNKFTYKNNEYLTIVLNANNFLYKILNKNGILSNRYNGFPFFFAIYIKQANNKDINKISNKIKKIFNNISSSISFSKKITMYTNKFKYVDVVINGKELENSDDENGSNKNKTKTSFVRKKLEIYWDSYKGNSLKDIKYLYLPKEVKVEVLKSIEYFDKILKSNEMVHNKKNYLLYGPPGTGKTTFSMSLAAYLDIPIYTFNTYDKLNDETFLSLYNQCESPCIISFEEADNLLLDYKSLNISKSIINNILDGNLSKNNVIITMTTNKTLEELTKNNNDESLFRHGRFDKKIHFKEPSRKEIISCIKSFSDINLDNYIDKNNNDIKLNLSHVKKCQTICTINYITKKDLSENERNKIIKDEILQFLKI